MRIVQYKTGYPHRSSFWNRYSFAIIKEVGLSTTTVSEIGGSGSTTVITPDQLEHRPFDFPGIATIIYNDEK